MERSAPPFFFFPPTRLTRLDLWASSHKGSNVSSSCFIKPRKSSLVIFEGNRIHELSEGEPKQSMGRQKIMEDFDEMRVEEDHAARAEAGSGAASSPPERQGDGVRLVIKNPAHDYDDYACRVR